MAETGLWQGVRKAEQFFCGTLEHVLSAPGFSFPSYNGILHPRPQTLTWALIYSPPFSPLAVTLPAYSLLDWRQRRRSVEEGRVPPILSQPVFLSARGTSLRLMVRGSDRTWLSALVGDYDWVFKSYYKWLRLDAFLQGWNKKRDFQRLGTINIFLLRSWPMLKSLW